MNSLLDDRKESSLLVPQFVRSQIEKYKSALYPPWPNDRLAIFGPAYSSQLRLGKNRLWLVDAESAAALRMRLPRFALRTRNILAQRVDELEHLDRLTQKQDEIIIASPTLGHQAISSPDALRQLAIHCSGRLWLDKNYLTIDERQARLALHRAGFYEVVDCLMDSQLDEQPSVRFDSSSIGIHPDGTMQLQGWKPGLGFNTDQVWLMASRLPLEQATSMPWVGVYGTGKTYDDGYLSSMEGNEPTLWIHQSQRLLNGSLTQRISGVFRWTSPVAAHESGALVGCYHGPGDTNMYLAMVTPLTNQHVELAIWRGSGGWDRVAHAIMSEDEISIELENHRSGCNRQLSITLEITRDCVRLLRDDKMLLEIWDQTIARNDQYGARFHSSVLQVGELHYRLD